MSDDQKPIDPRVQYEQLAKEAAIEKAEEEFKSVETELLAAYDDADTEENNPVKRSKALDIELADKWKHLKRIAMSQFPEGAKILGLSAQNRLVAIAFCLGWTQVDISNASGINKGTISKWLTQRPDVKLFIHEFNLKSGTSGKDIVKEEFSKLEYQAVQCIKSILSDKESSEGVKRLKLDASKWVFERTRGKPNQPLEHTGDGIRGLLDAISKAGNTPITKEKEEEIFGKTTH